MSIELNILDWFQTLHTPFLDKLMVFITSLGNAGIIWIVMTIVFLLIPKMRKTGAIMAAALRDALLRIGVTNGIIHISVGLIVSFGGPILAAYIMEKTTWLEFFLYPNKVLHSRSRIK